MMPRDSEYVPVRNIGANTDKSTRVPFLSNVNSQPPAELLAGYLPHPSLRVFEVSYSGLSTDASITLESDVCVQYTIPENNHLVDFARPSEMAPQGLLLNTLAAIGSAATTVARNTSFQKIVSDALRGSAEGLLRGLF